MEKDPTRSAAITAMWARRRAQPGGVEAVAAAISAGRKKRIAEDPDFAAALSGRSSATLKRLREDPKFRDRQSNRSTSVMNRLWKDPEFRDRATARNIRRYVNGIGINTPESEARKREAGKWIMTKCAEELRANDEYRALYAETQARLRREVPYDGPTDNATYMDYLSKLGTAVLKDPQVRRLKDSFMVEAIPRWAAAWQERPSR